MENFFRIFPRYGKIFSTVWKTALAGMMLAGAAGAKESPAPAPWVAESDWGPLASWIDDADGAERFRAAGPFWERAEGAGGQTLQACLRPVWARAADPAADRTSWDFLWPLASGKTFGKQRSWRSLLLYFFDRDRTDPRSQYRFWLFPLWFHGRDENGHGFAALFPVGGEIRNILLRDRVRFVLWPLWSQSQLNDVRTTDVLWPIYSRTTSPDGHREQLRVFPFYAYSKSARQYVKHAVLWPVWTHARYTHPKAKGTAWVLWPLLGHVNLNSQQGWMVLPPFFQHIRGDQLTRTYCPWPIIQRETGFRERLIVWPLYGYRKDGVLERRYWLWPFIIRENNVIGARQQVRWSLVPVFNSATQTEPPPGAAGSNAAPVRVTSQRTKLWPLYSRRYDVDARTYRLRLLELWPAVNPPAVERSWAPLWTVLDYRANGERSDLDVLWGLYRATRREGGARAFSLFPLWRHDRTAGDGARRWSVLKGLIAYDRTATNRQVRFLWLGRVRLAPPAATAAPMP